MTVPQRPGRRGPGPRGYLRVHLGRQVVADPGQDDQLRSADRLGGVAGGGGAQQRVVGAVQYQGWHTELGQPAAVPFGADLLDIGEQARAIMRRHPWLPPLLTTRPVLGPNGLVLLEHVLEALAPHPASSAAKLEALGLLNAATALFVQNELADGPDRQQRNAAYLRYALAAGQRPRLAELLAAPSSPPGTSPAEAASHPADRYRDILARILSGLLAAPREPQARRTPASGRLRQ